MLTKGFNPTRRILFYIGFFIFSIGTTFNRTFGLPDTPEFLAVTSLPLICTGLIILILSNFFREKRKK